MSFDDLFCKGGVSEEDVSFEADEFIACPVLVEPGESGEYSFGFFDSGSELVEGLCCLFEFVACVCRDLFFYSFFVVLEELFLLFFEVDVFCQSFFPCGSCSDEEFCIFFAGDASCSVDVGA